MQVRVVAVTQLGDLVECAPLHELTAALAQAVGALHEVALQDADSQVRRKAVAQLLRLRATPALAEAARCDIDVRVREAALEALGELQQVSMLCAFSMQHAGPMHTLHTRCTQHTFDMHMPCTGRAQAVHRPCTCHTHAHAMHILRQAEPIVDGSLLDAAPRIRARAVEILGGLGEVEPLGEIALQDANLEIRRSAAHHLVKLRAPRLLLPAFSDVSDEVRLVAVEGMQTLVLDGNAEVLGRQATADAGGGAGGPHAHVDLRHEIVQRLMGTLADNERPHIYIYMYVSRCMHVVCMCIYWWVG